MKDEARAGSEPVARASSPPSIDSAPSFFSGQDARATTVHKTPAERRRNSTLVIQNYREKALETNSRRTPQASQNL